MNELGRALIGNSAAAPAKNILQAIPEEMAKARVGLGSTYIPRSIYEEVWHLDFWQRISLDWVEGRAVPYPEHAAEGFPESMDETWDDLRLSLIHI